VHLLSTASTSQRIESLDLLRGAVMVLMVLDHVRDYAFAGTFHVSATDLTQVSPAVFLTRWVTHFCAPTFVLLAGASAGLQASRGTPRPELARFLLTRGLWLVFLELTVVRLGIRFDLHYGQGLAYLQVIWAIGVSMMLLAGGVYLPRGVLGVLGAAMVLGHNALDGFGVATGPVIPGAAGNAATTLGAAAWTLLHVRGSIALFGAEGTKVVVAYPLIPWVGVMALGYLLGGVYTWEAARRRRFLWRLGAGLTLGFLVLRASNLYGDPSAWTPQASAVTTALAFLNTTKYPPSLLYLLMTCGPALMALAALEAPGAKNAFTAGLVTLGRVPMLFYLLQWYVAHLLALGAGLAFGRPVGYLIANFGGGAAGTGAGFGLAATYGLWLCAIAILFPLCRAFAQVKQRRRDLAWLRYL